MAAVHGPLLWLPVTLAIYAAGTALYRGFNKAPFLNPTLFTIAGVAAILITASVPYEKYFEAVSVLHYLLGTAVVALALPLYGNLRRLQGRGVALVLGLVAGRWPASWSGWRLRAWRAPRSSPSVARPEIGDRAVSMEIARLTGGVPAVTGVLTILTGIIGAVTGPYVLISPEFAPRGARVCPGVASHGIATARAFSEGRSPAPLRDWAWRSTRS